MPDSDPDVTGPHVRAVCGNRRNEAGQSLRCAAASFSPGALGLQEPL